MNSKGHLIISLIKSGIRIIGCGLALCHNSLLILDGALILAEVLGVIEETVDQR